MSNKKGNEMKSSPTGSGGTDTELSTGNGNRLPKAARKAVLAWLADIGETNPENIKSTLEKSRANAKVLAWILEKSKPAVKAKPQPN
jgi:hypothetical protein